MKVLHPMDIFQEGRCCCCFSLVVSLTSDLPHGSARNLLVLWGLQVKPRFSPESMKQSESHAQELAKIRLLPFVSHTQRFSSWSAKRNIVLCFIFICHCFCSGVSISLHDECCWVVRFRFRDSKWDKLLASPLEIVGFGCVWEKWMPTMWIYLVHFSAFAILDKS